ncbi:potassium-transporting ATPase subunit C [bacterium]|nr:potassium-transporting ATPase subunit C [bacterium]
MKALRANTLLFAASVGVCCVLYPLALWAFGQVLFPTKANGSLVTKADGTVVGSRQVAQAFTKDEYFWPRPSAAGYNAAAAGGSNWGAASPKLRDRAAQLLGPLARYTTAGPRKGAPVGPDVEAWFAAVPDRAAAWAAGYPTSAAAWAKGEEVAAFIQTWAEEHPEVPAAWKAANPDKADEPKPDELVGPFFDSFVKTHPGTFPGVVEGKAADGKVEKTVRPVTEGTTIQALFFDMWLQDPANRARAADIERVPADFVTASGAGLDPHITLRNARWQLPRVAAARAGSGDAAAARQRIEAVLTRAASAPLGGLAGEPFVNVLEVNLALDAEFAGR